MTGGINWTIYVLWLLKSAAGVEISGFMGVLNLLDFFFLNFQLLQSLFFCDRYLKGLEIWQTYASFMYVFFSIFLMSVGL